MASLGGRGGANLLGGGGGIASNQLGRSTPGSGVGLGGAYAPASALGAGSPLSSITIGGGAPTSQDYASQILSDPAFTQLRNSLSAQGIHDAASLRGAVQQALIQFGGVPNLSQEVLSNTGLDTSGTAALAANNPFSTLKRLQQSYQDQQDSAKNALAARGILSSGETGFQLGRLGQQQAGAQYDATNSLLGGIGSLNDQYVAGQQAAAQALSQGALTAENTAAASGQSAAGGGVTATWDPSTGLYKDPSGAFYDQGGNPVSFAGGGVASQSQPATSAPAVAPAPDTSASGLYQLLQQGALSGGVRPSVAS